MSEVLDYAKPHRVRVAGRGSERGLPRGRARPCRPPAPASPSGRRSRRVCPPIRDRPRARARGPRQRARRMPPRPCEPNGRRRGGRPTPLGHRSRSGTMPREGGGVIVVVHDDGPGLDPAVAARLFEPFFTTRRGGTGLGLAIARNIVDGLGGTITVAGRTPAGTDVRLTLPPAPPQARRGLAHDHGNGRHGGHRDRPDRGRRGAHPRGPGPRAARGGPRRGRGRRARRAAQRLLAERAFDVLVVDNIMPDLTGLDLIRRPGGSTSGRASGPRSC
ncbi:MAG: hybrid sensor histidine kinase/response regulator [Sphingobacterium sp.]|nr:hybrid sensor histidine kinase/response regulator [Sphingobacterium sp.]